MSLFPQVLFQRKQCHSSLSFRTQKSTKVELAFIFELFLNHPFLTVSLHNLYYQFCGEFMSKLAKASFFLQSQDFD